jgi:hypothetical protein
MRQRYLSLVLLAILAALAVSGCSSLGGLFGPPTPTPIPFERYDAEDVFNAFARAGLQVGSPTQSMDVGRGAPVNFRSRYIFEVPRIAPNGGQIVVFSTPEQMAEWQTYIRRLDGDSTTHRNVIYTYWTANLMLQMSATLTNAEAAAYRDAFMALT